MTGKFKCKKCVVLTDTEEEIIEHVKEVHKIKKGQPYDYLADYMEKKQALNDGFYYEVWMVSEALQIHSSVLSKIPMISNACIETTVFKTRLLLEFFRKNRTYPKDMIAQDFLRSGETWDGINLIEYPNLNKVHDRVNEEVAHLSYGRILITKTSWNLFAILIELSKILDIFLSKCDNNYVEQKLQDIIALVDKQAQTYEKLYAVPK